MNPAAVVKLLEMIQGIRISNRIETGWSGFKWTGQKHRDIQDTTCPGTISLLSIHPDKQEAILDCSVCKNSICYKYQPAQKP